MADNKTCFSGMHHGGGGGGGGGGGRGRGRDGSDGFSHVYHSLHLEIHNFLLFPTEALVNQVSLDTPLFADVHIPVRNFRTATSLDVDILYDEIYWTDQVDSKIYRASLSGGQPQAIVSLDLVTPEAIVVDWIGRVMYWSDSGTGFIEVGDLNGRAREVLVSEGLEQVTSLALDIQSR